METLYRFFADAWSEFAALSPLQKILAVFSLPVLAALLGFRTRLSQFAAKFFRRTRIEESRARILIVDDELASVDDAARTLRLAGYEVEMFESPPAAIERAKTFEPDLVILDGQMAPFGGPETLRRLREIRDVRAILLTSFQPQFPEELSLIEGFDDYVAKGPGVAGVLKARVDAQLRRAK